MTNELPGEAPRSSALSLLVNAVDTRDGIPRGAAVAGTDISFQDRVLTEPLLRTGLGGETGPLHEELMRQKQESLRQAALHAQNHHHSHHQQQQQEQQQQPPLAQQQQQQQQQEQQQQQPPTQQQSSPGASLLQQLSESQQISQQLSHQLSQSDIRSALASAQLRQAPQLSNADIMALARSGALPNLGGIIGASGLASLTGGVGTSSSFDQLADLQGLEEIERRQLLLAGLTHMSGPGQLIGQAQQAQVQSSDASRKRVEPTQAASGGSPLPGLPQGQDPPSFMGFHSSFPGDTAGPGAAPPPADCTEKKEQGRDPGSVVVPCRARGMPMDHNFKTAYFVIPENVRHGEELICSYFACRNAGVKFRYCSHCKVPVAKRNFRKRHRHGDNDKSKGIVDDDDDSVGEGSRSEENGDCELDDIPTQVTAKIQDLDRPLKERPKDAPPQGAILSTNHQIAAKPLNTHQQLMLQRFNVPQVAPPERKLSRHRPSVNSRDQHNLQQGNAGQRQLEFDAKQQLSTRQRLVVQQHHLVGQQHYQADPLYDKRAHQEQHLKVQKPCGRQHLNQQVSMQQQQQLISTRECFDLGSVPQHLAPVDSLKSARRHGDAIATLSGISSFPIKPVGANPTSKVETLTMAPPMGQQRKKVLGTRRDDWLHLLENRPYTTDSDTMSAWLVQVLAVSDLTMPVFSSYAGESKQPEEKDDQDNDVDDMEDIEESIKDDSEASNEVNELEEDPKKIVAPDKEDDKSSDPGKGKKRSVVDMNSVEEDISQPQVGVNRVESGHSVSFAEWRDRKKQKKGIAKKSSP